MIFSVSVLVGLLASSLSSAIASPVANTHHLQKRGAILTAQYATESEDSGLYTLAQNLWGEAGYTGSQTSQVLGWSGNTIKWWTAFTWSGGPNNVKSYANIALNANLSKPLSAIKSIPSVWDWQLLPAGNNAVGDVAYDLWLSTTPGSTGATSKSSYEIMIWLSAGGATPAGSQIGTASISGLTWQLWKGTVGSWTVFSFVPPSVFTSYSADLKPFFTYLESYQGVASSQYLVQAQAGIEPHTGTANLSTTAYSLGIILLRRFLANSSVLVDAMACFIASQRKPVFVFLTPPKYTSDESGPLSAREQF